MEDLDGFVHKLNGVRVVLPLRKTSYSTAEIGIREPGGQHVIFAALPTQLS